MKLTVSALAAVAALGLAASTASAQHVLVQHRGHYHAVPTYSAPVYNSGITYGTSYYTPGVSVGVTYGSPVYGGGFAQPAFGGYVQPSYSGGFGGYTPAPRGHLDYVPGHFDQHRGHLDYHPGHYDYHRSGTRGPRH